MPVGVVCPLDGTRLVLTNGTNVAGDPIHRWECPVDDWAGPWYSSVTSGRENEPIPELLRDVEFIASPIPAAITGTPTVNPVDDYDSFEAIHQILASATDTTFVFMQAVRAVRVSNWNTLNVVLVKDGPIISDTDASSARVGRAPVSSVPGQMWFPFATNTVHLRSAASVEVTVEGYFGSV
jgi:hypothetical protein